MDLEGEKRKGRDELGGLLAGSLLAQLIICSASCPYDLCGLHGPQYHDFGLSEDSAILGRGEQKMGRGLFGTMTALGTFY